MGWVEGVVVGGGITESKMDGDRARKRDGDGVKDRERLRQTQRHRGLMQSVWS